VPLPLQVSNHRCDGTLLPACDECDEFFLALALVPGLWTGVQHSGPDLYERYCGLKKAEHPPKERMQAMRLVEHLRAQPPPQKRVQAIRRFEHLRAQSPQILLQAMQWAGHLRAHPCKEELQGLSVEGGLVLTSRTEQL
jgi:hypothetical protein